MVEDLSAYSFTRRENQVPLTETLDKCRGFSVSSLIIIYQKWDTERWDTPYRRMSNKVPSLIRIPRKAFEKKVRFLFL